MYFNDYQYAAQIKENQTAVSDLVLNEFKIIHLFLREKLSF